MSTVPFLSLRTFKKFSVFLLLVKGHFSSLFCLHVLIVFHGFYLSNNLLCLAWSILYLILLQSTLPRCSLFSTDETLNTSITTTTFDLTWKNNYIWTWIARHDDKIIQFICYWKYCSFPVVAGRIISAEHCDTSLGNKKI